MRAILINPEDKTITETDISSEENIGYAAWEKLIGHYRITRGHNFSNENYIIARQFRLEDPKPPYTFLWQSPDDLGFIYWGKALIIGNDEYGDPTDCSLTIVEVTKLINFRK